MEASEASLDSYPRSRTTIYDHPSTSGGSAVSSRIRPMCSYGGHILRDGRSFRYFGGDTRIVDVDRNTCLSSLLARLSNRFLDGRLFTLKYKLPGEDLEFLISVTTDKDLDNMIEEYDSAISASTPSRLHLFLFTSKPQIWTRFNSDDERSDHGVPTGYMMPPSLRLRQLTSISGGHELPSPDSVCSDSSTMLNPMFHRRPSVYHFKFQGKFVERLLMRVVAAGLHQESTESAMETYHWMFQGWFPLPSPTFFFNAVTPRPQDSCNLGTIRSSCLSAGIMDLSSPVENVPFESHPYNLAGSLGDFHDKLTDQVNANNVVKSQRNKAPVGFYNHDNNCYIISILQCLTYTPPFANFCLSGEHSSQCKSIVDGKHEEHCPLCIVERRVRKSLTMIGSFDIPGEISERLSSFGNQFQKGAQEDCHEFLLQLIVRCSLTCHAKVMQEIFEASLNNLITCLTCGFASKKSEKSVAFSLAVNNSNSVANSLNNFFLPEVLDVYHCKSCSKHMKAERKTSILQEPTIFIIHLKRFDAQGVKIDEHIPFEEHLSLSSFMMHKESKEPKSEYKLFAIVVHVGSTPTGGHYYACIEDLGQWYRCDNVKINPVTLEEVLREKAYVLFYKKVCAGDSNGVITKRSVTCEDGLESNLQKITKTSSAETVEDMDTYGLKASLIVRKNAARLNSEIVDDRNFHYDFLGIKMLEELYLFKSQGKVVESPQDMLMRVAVGIHKEDIASAIKTYHLMSQGWFIHASPTLSNAGTSCPQLSSSFIMCMKDEGIEGLYETLKECAFISNSAGCTGISATGSGKATGIVPMLGLLNATACYVEKGGGKTNGAFAVYLEPWHAEVFEFLVHLENQGKEKHSSRGLSYALWVPDLFIERLLNGGKWSLFCPHDAPGLADCWGDDFEGLYKKYEGEKKAKKEVEAMDVWYAILRSQLKTGSPCIVFKDSCNRKSNQQNLGTIKSSSVSAEIMEFSSPSETAVCTHASIALPRFVREKDVPLESHPRKLAGSLGSKNRYFDFDKLAEVSATVTINLDKIIDVNYYPVETAKTSNMRHRPIGIGVQGLADAFILLGMPFDSQEARQLNKDIFETIYYHALKTSSELAAKVGTYETYKGSPVSKGILQPDMWDVTPSDRWEWAVLRDAISKNGVRNSLLVAPMLSDSTSQILGNNECFEPYESNCRGLSGDVVVVNKHLVHDLTDMGLWTSSLEKKIINENGSVVKVAEIPDHLKAIYRTAWEIKQKAVVDMAVDRGCYIDQSQSFNIHLDKPTYEKLTMLHVYCWRMGLKTGMYRLHSRDATEFV